MGIHNLNQSSRKRLEPEELELLQGHQYDVGRLTTSIIMSTKSKRGFEDPNPDVESPEEDDVFYDEEDVSEDNDDEDANYDPTMEFEDGDKDIPAFNYPGKPQRPLQRFNQSKSTARNEPAQRLNQVVKCEQEVVVQNLLQEKLKKQRKHSTKKSKKLKKDTSG